MELLPIKPDLETKAILRKTTEAHKAAELKGVISSISKMIRN